MSAVDYGRLDWQSSEHHRRYLRRVESQRPQLPCQNCGGMGGEIDPVLDYGEGPWEPCGWCEGTGLLTPWMRSMWLACKRYEKRKMRGPVPIRKKVA